MKGLPATAIVHAAFDYAVREINALEARIAATEDEADAMLWHQAEQVVAQLHAGVSQRELAAQWINARTGEPYTQPHVSLVKRVFEKCTFQTPRPRFRDLYNEIANATSGKVNRLLSQTGGCEWYTPRAVIELARLVLGAIDLDPASCAEANTVVQAKRFHTREDDGLKHAWTGRVFLNPPYNPRDMKPFCDKLAHHVTAGDITAAIVVTLNSTDTRWFATLTSVASAICFPRYRLRNWQPDRTTDTALQGQVVFYAGPKPATFFKRFQKIGLVVRPWS